MEPVYMVLGQAAVLSIESGQSVQDVLCKKLSERLVNDGQIFKAGKKTRS